MSDNGGLGGLEAFFASRGMTVAEGDGKVAKFFTWFFTIITAIGVILTVILVPLSFNYVPIAQQGLLRNLVSNQILYEEGFFPAGRYHTSPGFTFALFPAILIDFELAGAQGLSVFLDDGLEAFVELSFQVYLESESLPELHSKFTNNYEERILVVATVAVKNIAPTFSFDDWVQDRARVAKAMEEVVAEDLKEIFVVLTPGKLQLRRVILPDPIREKFTRVFVQSKINIRQEKQKETTLVIKETEQIVAQFDANITIVETLAAAEFQTAVQTAKAQAEADVQVELGLQLENIFSQLGLTDPQARSDFLLYVSIINEELVDPSLLIGINSGIIITV